MSGRFLARARFRAEREAEMLREQTWRMRVVREREQFQQAALRQRLKPITLRRAVDRVATKVCCICPPARSTASTDGPTNLHDSRGDNSHNSET